MVVTVRVVPLMEPTKEQPFMIWGAAAVAYTVVPNVPVTVGAPVDDTAVYIYGFAAFMPAGLVAGGV